MQYLWKFLKWLPGGITILLMWCAQVGPKEAASHLAEWLSLVGIENIPPWLASKAADKWAFWIGLAGFLVWGAFLLSSKLMKASLHEPSSEPPGYGYRVVTGIEKHEWAGDVATKTHTYQEVTRGAARPKETRDEFISMKEAATIAYEELRECRSVYAWAAEKLGPSSTQSRAEGTLDWFVYFLPSRISLFGKRPPSRKLELIDPQEFKRGGFNDLGQSFSYFGEKEPRYTDLMVKRDDLDKLIESLRKDNLGP